MKTRNARRIKINVTERQFEEAMEKYAQSEQREAEINKCIEADVNEVLERYEDELLTLAQGKTIAFELVQSYCNK